MATQHVVTRLAVVVELIVWVGFGIISANVASHAYVQGQRCRLAQKDVHVVQREVVALIGRMGRGRIRERAGMLHRYVQYTEIAAQLETFVQGNLPCVLVELAFNDEW